MMGSDMDLLESIAALESSDSLHEARILLLIKAFGGENGEGQIEGLTKLAKLDFLKEAREVAKRLCGHAGPFGTSEVLDTHWGSRCFRSILEANPEAAIDALEREFGSLSTEQLLAVRSGRRGLVGSLAKLAFRREMFERAARLLLAFAAAENESWSNNELSLSLYSGICYTSCIVT